MLPLAYGKFHALTVLCILAEPRIAQDRWHRDNESSGNPSGSAQQARTPHMDYSRPSQFNAAGESSSRRRRHSTSSTRGEYIFTPRLPFDGDDGETGTKRRSAHLNPITSSSSSRSTASASGSVNVRPGMMSRKISEAPTACTCLSAGSTALNPGTPVWELDVEKKEMAEMEAVGATDGQPDQRTPDSLVVQVEPIDDGTFSFAELMEGERRKA